MSFGDMDRIEATYVNSRAIDDQAPLTEVKAWKLTYAEPKDEDEDYKIRMARELEQERLNKNIIVFIVGEVFAVIYWLFVGLAVTAFLLIIMFILLIPIGICLWYKKRLTDSAGVITKVRATDSLDRIVYRRRFNKTHHYFLSVVQDETGMYVKKVRVDRDMYEGYQYNRPVYLVKFRKRTVRAIYE